jgi:hypothetical protein
MVAFSSGKLLLSPAWIADRVHDVLRRRGAGAPVSLRVVFSGR